MEVNVFFTFFAISNTFRKKFLFLEILKNAPLLTG